MWQLLQWLHGKQQQQQWWYWGIICKVAKPTCEISAKDNSHTMHCKRPNKKGKQTGV